ncbi:cytochrome c-type biogenesis protein [Propioniferax innocua]|uniref:Cytochrome c-type biogenesis protein n=2 Tax=Propioniferax innocua TaxID=1753 RepID=A0A542ZCK4_9ACTN|nr:cytochrome c-type biogenesis protein [Propioniferax innocua]
MTPIQAPPLSPVPMVLPPLDMGTWAADAVGGSMLLAIPVAMLAGLVSFLSPCVVPLLPGYVSYMTGMSAADVVAGRGARGRMLLGSLGFVLGFAVFFVASGVLAGTVGAALHAHARLLAVVLGVLTIVLGLMFAGVLKFGQVDLRLQTRPIVGVAASPLLGLLFGIGWTPCIGPTLAVVLGLSLNEGSAMRGGILMAAYALGLGIPFIVAALAFTRVRPLVGFVQRHQQVLLRLGGGMLIVVGVLLVTGWWAYLMGFVQQWAAEFGVIL